MMNFILKYLIKKYDIITFDIFDTLIERTVLSPLDIFLIAGKKVLGEEKAEDFLISRKKAEDDARKKVINGEITLDEIYECLPKQYFHKREVLKQAEIQAELSCCKKKGSMAEIFQYSLDSGKTIYLISDMYLSKEIIEKILNNCGVKGYKNCYVSCERHCNKISGELFKTVLEENRITNRSVLHIGDSLKADFWGARKAGIQSFLISRKNRFKRLLHDKSIRSKC